MKHLGFRRHHAWDRELWRKVNAQWHADLNQVSNVINKVKINTVCACVCVCVCLADLCVAVRMVSCYPLLFSCLELYAFGWNAFIGIDGLLFLVPEVCACNVLACYKKTSSFSQKSKICSHVDVQQHQNMNKYFRKVHCGIVPVIPTFSFRCCFLVSILFNQIKLYDWKLLVNTSVPMQMIATNWDYYLDLIANVQYHSFILCWCESCGCW